MGEFHINFLSKFFTYPTIACGPAMSGLYVNFEANFAHINFFSLIERCETLHNTSNYNHIESSFYKQSVLLAWSASGLHITYWSVIGTTTTSPGNNHWYWVACSFCLVRDWLLPTNKLGQLVCVVCKRKFPSDYRSTSNSHMHFNPEGGHSGMVLHTFVTKKLCEMYFFTIRHVMRTTCLGVQNQPFLWKGYVLNTISNL